MQWLCGVFGCGYWVVGLGMVGWGVDIRCTCKSLKHMHRKSFIQYRVKCSVTFCGLDVTGWGVDKIGTFA